LKREAAAVADKFANAGGAANSEAAALSEERAAQLP